MDGIIGLIVFALISFAYNKLVERSNQQNTPKKDLDDWLEQNNTPEEVQKTEKTKKQNQKELKKHLLSEKIEEKYDRDNRKTDLATQQENVNLKPPFDKIEGTQSPNNKELTIRKNKSRKNLNFKSKKTLRQAFILNTVLSKPKSYEP